MSYDHAFKGEIARGHFIPDDYPRWSRALAKFEGKRVQLTLGAERKRRGDSQLAFYWTGIVRTVALETAGDEYDKHVEDDIHHHLLVHVLLPMFPERFVRPTKRGRRVDVQPSTGVLSYEEMGAYLGRCKDYALREWGVHVPDRDQVVVRKDHA